MRPVGVSPPGLLSLFQLKQLGRNPDSVQDNYQPTVEVLRWLALQQKEYLQVGFTTLAAGTTATFNQAGAPLDQVPENEYWYVHVMSGGIVKAAGADVITNFSIGMRVDAAGTAKIFQLPASAASPPDMAGVVMGITAAAFDFWAPSGAQFGLFYNRTGAGNALGSLSAMITRLRV